MVLDFKDETFHELNAAKYSIFHFCKFFPHFHFSSLRKSRIVEQKLTICEFRQTNPKVRQKP